MSTLTGTIILTGANGGIGGGIASAIIKSSYSTTHHTIYPVRDLKSAEHLQGILSQAPKSHKYELPLLDLSSLQCVRSFATVINTKVSSGSIPPIQALILNAGCQSIRTRGFTTDKKGRTFQVNYLSNFVLSSLLLQSMDKKFGRIIFTGSTTTRVEWSPNSHAYTIPEQRETIISKTENMAKGIEDFPDGKV